MLLEPDSHTAGKAAMHFVNPRVENVLTYLELGAENTFTSLSFKAGDYKRHSFIWEPTVK